jgi:hypothetical protein
MIQGERDNKMKRNLATALAAVMVLGLLFISASGALSARADPSPRSANAPPDVRAESIGYSCHWIKTYHSFFAGMIGSEYDEAVSVVPTGDRESVVAGNLRFYFNSASQAPIEQSLAMQVRPSGSIGWQTILDLEPFGNTCNSLFSIIPTRDGGYIATGYYSWTIYPYPISNFVVKFGHDGAVQWVKSYGRDVFWSCLAETSDDGILLASDDNSSHGLSLYKLDANGDVLWHRLRSSKSILNYGWYQPNAIQPTADGGFIIVGGAYSDYPVVAVVIKVDANGNEVWNRTVHDNGPGYENSTANSVVCEPDGSCIVAGMIGDNCGCEHSVTDSWVFKLNAAGRMIWQKAYEAGEIRRLIKIRDGGYLALGNAYALKLSKAGDPQWQVQYDQGIADGCETKLGGIFLAGNGISLLSLDGKGTLGSACASVTPRTPRALMTSARMGGDRHAWASASPSVRRLAYQLTSRACTTTSICLQCIPRPTGKY